MTTPPKVLVVDDDRMFRVMIAKCLGADRQIFEAVDGEEALAALEKDRFDLVILDWNMPGKSGIDVLREFRAYDHTTPVIMATAVSEAPSVVEAIQAGVTDYVPKPFKAQFFRDKVETILQATAQQAADEETQPSEGNLALSKQWLASVSQTVIDSFRHDFHVKLAPDEPRLLTNARPLHEMNGVMHLYGEIHGLLVLSLSRELAFAVVGKQRGRTPRIVNEQVMERLAEQFERVRQHIIEHKPPGCDLELGVLELVIGRTHYVDFPPQAAPVEVVYHSNAGDMAVQLGVTGQATRLAHA